MVSSMVGPAERMLVLQEDCRLPVSVRLQTVCTYILIATAV